MIWLVCLILATICLVLIGLIGASKRFGRLRILYVLMGCALAAYLLYTPLLFANNAPVAAILGGLINVLQVVTLDADFIQSTGEIHGLMGNSVLEQVYVVILALVHVLLPSISAMSAVTVIVQCLTDLHLNMISRSKKTIHIFSNLNYQTTILASDIRSHEQKSKILILSQAGDFAYSELRDQLGCDVVSEKIENIQMRTGNRRVHYYFISDDQEENLNAALAMLSTLQDAKSQRNTSLFIFTTDPMAEMIIDSLDKGFTSITIIDKERTAAYGLLTRYPLAKYAVDKKINVLIFGFGSMGKMFLRSAAWCGQLFGYELNLTVIGRDIQEEADDFKVNFPGLFTDRYNIRLLNYHTQEEFFQLLNQEKEKATYVVVAEENSQDTVDKAVKLRRYYYSTDEAFAYAPPIFAYIENEARAAAVAALQTAEAKAERRMSYGITPFGTAKEIYSFANITESDVEILSKNVHMVYEDIFSDGPIDVDGALIRYNLFEVNKNSNRANAMHIRYKLLMMGLDYTDDPDAEEVELSEYLTEEFLEQLTYAEHDRWMAFLDTEGWVESTIAQVQKYQASGISRGRHNCPLLKMHPYICPFEELVGRSDSLGLPDSTVYDRDLISRIPDILHDKWNVAPKKYKIIKQTSIGKDS